MASNIPHKTITAITRLLSAIDIHDSCSSSKYDATSCAALKRRCPGVSAHCLTQIVTLRKWLPQLICY